MNTAVTKQAQRYLIRPMRRDDIPAVVAIEQDSFPDPWTPHMFEEELHNREAHLFSLTHGSSRNVVGYCCYRIILDTADLMNIAVHHKHRGTQAGIQLMDHMIAEFRKKKVRFVFLEVRSNNNPAISLYRKYGFVTQRIRRRYYQKTGEHAHEMLLVL
ncbi:MAG: ribosomal-protein-alanine N-acetyltransferase [Elusimicrobia bacterium]|nr:ribosomal-protein-alanine N-acetyltransferase [Elusimicrobiota bacterium]MBD3412218.1 ribosomal-protein-alanine N-acetyltransferase [Elusimicrobiota bacterium]